MYIYLDESGDLGFGNKASKYFVITLLITKDTKPINNCIKRIKQRRLKKKYLKLDELKFNNSSKLIRNKVLTCLANKNIEVCYILIDKLKVPKIEQTLKTEFYTNLSGFLIQQILQSKENIELIVDKSLSREKRAEFNKYVKNLILKKIRVNIKIKVEHKSSYQDKCLQAVDFISGAIFAKHEHNNCTYFNLIQDKIKQVIIYEK